MPKPAFSTVGNTSIATDRLASARAKPTLAKNSASVDCTSASISGLDAAWHGGTVQEVANTTTRRTRQLARILDRTDIRTPLAIRRHAQRSARVSTFGAEPPRPLYAQTASVERAADALKR